MIVGDGAAWLAASSCVPSSRHAHQRVAVEPGRRLLWEPRELDAPTYDWSTRDQHELDVQRFCYRSEVPPGFPIGDSVHSPPAVTFDLEDGKGSAVGSSVRGAAGAGRWSVRTRRTVS